MDEAKKVKKKPDWRKIKAAYQRGDGTQRDLAVKFGVPESTLMGRAMREKWSLQKKQIESKVEAKVVDALAMGALSWVAATLTRAQKARGIIDASVEQFAVDEQGRPLIDLLNVNTMLQAESKIDDLARRSFGLSDTPQKVEHSGTINVIDPYAEGVD